MEPIEDVQPDVGHADPRTTKLYDRRGHDPKKSASFFANYQAHPTGFAYYLSVPSHQARGSPLERRRLTRSV